ncbi:zinc finger protein OZF-like [Anthonomus grandis grandis]|uniref:zinc finger protein OZF-like n=1 Tax=Anthonomus grandis grandis TaxID=2921223 RepID=UPI0021662D3C|nr:zinc finger protein OZF-like [Anthonomus grandis grandis]
MEPKTNVCCICLKTTEGMQRLISENNSQPTIQLKLQSLVPEQEWLGHYLICVCCSTELERAYNFRLLCLQNAATRETLILQPKEEDSKCFDVIIPQSEPPEMDFKCHHCDESFKSKTSIKSHLKTNHDKEKLPKFTCDTCSEPFFMLKDIINHCKQVHSIPEKDIRPYKCSLCGNQYRSKTVLVQHQKYHKNIRDFICSSCGKNFVTKQDLQAHETYHDNNRTYLCKKCDKSFITRSNLSTHILVSHTDKSQWKFSCLVCSNKFALKSHLNDHQKRHAGSKNFTCHICDKHFITKTELNVHTKNHSNIKQHHCDMCSKCYRDKRNLLVHLSREHGKDAPGVIIERAKPFFCHSCPKRFPDRYKLNRHLRTHSGHKPFSCNVCFKQFSDSRNLKRHSEMCGKGDFGSILN